MNHDLQSINSNPGRKNLFRNKKTGASAKNQATFKENNNLDGYITEKLQI